MMDKVDNTNPQGKWEFNEEVSRVFGDMLSRSIPDYEVMRSLCYRVGRNFLKGGVMVDLGCSNGLSALDFVRDGRGKVVLCDVSEPMLEECRKLYGNIDGVTIMNHDIVSGMPCTDADLILSVLTLQFTPIEYRQDIVKNIYDSLHDGGAFIMVEKVLGNSATLDNMLVKEYYEMKRENGYTEERIRAKRKSLEGVLVPLTSHFDEELLRGVGFRAIDCFWRCLNFAGWIAVK